MIPFNRPPYTGNEDQHVLAAMRSDKISGNGFYTQRCQDWFVRELQCKAALLTPSCTQALEMAAILADIQPGDEVIMPSFTFVSTANAFVLRGATIVFVDVRPDTMNINELLIEAAITARTKAIVPVHYAGVACEMDTIMAIAQRHDLIVIEDAAQAILSTYRGRKLGTIGHLAAFSFHETKNITSGGEGGLLIINDDRFVTRAEIIREKGTNRALFFRGMVDKYSWVDIGSSYLPSEIQAAYLWGQLELVESITEARIAICEQYCTALSELERQGLISLPVIPAECSQNGHMMYLKTSNLAVRTALLEHLKAAGVLAVFHYVPLHSAEAGSRYARFHGADVFTTPDSERLLRLPVWYGLDTQTVAQIIGMVVDFFSLRQRSCESELSSALDALIAQEKDHSELYQAIAGFTDLEAMSSAQREYCQARLIAYLEHPTQFQRTPNNYLFCASLLAQRFAAAQGIGFLCRVLDRLPDATLRHQLFWNVVSLNFRKNAGCQAEIYQAYGTMAAAWNIEVARTDYACASDCIILTTQLLSRLHAPSADAFGYFKILKKLGFHPLIINTDELPRQCGLPLINPIIANASIYPAGMTKVDSDGIDIEIFTPGKDMPDPVGLGIVCALIAQIKPRFIFGIGSFGILQERLAAQYRYLILPLSVDLTPGQHCYSVLFRKLKPADRDFMQRFSLDESRILDGYAYQYELPSVDPVDYTRAQFGLASTDFVICIVGNRLNDELDRHFMDFLADVIAIDERIKLLLVGAISEQLQNSLTAALKAESFRHLAFSSDLLGLYRICDLYLNPPRLGGGTSAAFALAASVPVLSLAFGDVANMLPDAFVMQSLAQMQTAIGELLLRADQRETRDLARAVFMRMSDRTGMVSELLQRIGVDLPLPLPPPLSAQELIQSDS